MRFTLLALGNVNGRASQADDAAGTSQRLDVKVKPPGSGAVGKADFRVLGFAALDGTAFERNEFGAALGRKNFLIGTTDDVVDIKAIHWVTDGRVAKLAIL